MTEQLSPALAIEELTAEHWSAVEAIYWAGIATGHATIEAERPTWEGFDARLPRHRLVALSADGRGLGWAAASAVSDRCAYAGVIEHSVYVDPPAQGRGVGRRSLEALLDDARSHGVWTVQSGVFPENAPSLAVRAPAGFRAVGTRERLGKMSYDPLADQWRDVVLLEMRL